MSTIEKYILTTLVVIFVVVFVRWLKRYLRRNEIHESFPYLFPFEKNPVDAHQIIRIDLPNKARVKGEILLPNGDVKLVVFEEVLEKGIQTKGMHTDSLSDGMYELRLTFPNQVTTRGFEVRRKVIVEN